MKRFIPKLALSNLRQNKVRSILIILSIFFTTLLLAAIAGFGCGMVRHNRQNAGNIYGNYCGTFVQVSEEQYQQMKLRSEFAHVGKGAYVAQVNAENAENGTDLGLSFVDHTAAENINLPYSLITGKLPDQEYEIAASCEFFSLLGLNDAKPGDLVTVPYRKDHQSVYRKQQFTVSGVIKSQTTGVVQKAFQGYVSQDFYESLYPKEQRSLQVMFRLSDSVKPYGDSEEFLQELGALVGIGKKQVAANRGYMIWAYEPGTETAMTCIVIALLVILVSVAVIYNIFQVGVVQKIQEYGKIRALGATKKQMKRLVLTEGMILAAIGIPLGILFGTVIAGGMFEQIVLSGSGVFVGVPLSEVSVISLPLLLVVALAALVTIRLALSHPMRTAAKISPVEAMRYQESAGRKKSVRKGRKRISVLGMTLAVLADNRRRTVSAILTMGLSCVLFVVLSNVAGNFDNEFEARRTVEYGQFSMELDCSLNDDAYPENNLFYVQRENPLGEAFQKQLQAIPGVTEVKSVKVFAVENLKANNKDEEGDRSTVCVLDREGFERYGSGSVLGNIDYDQVSAKDGILYGFSVFFNENGHEIGQQMRWKDLTGGQAEYQGEIMGSLGSAPGSWVITEETFQKLGITEDVTEKIWVDCDERDKESVEAAIEALLSGISHVETDSFDNAMKKAELGTSVMQYGVYAFLALLGIIGFFNMANTIITGVVTRKHELGVLQAVGMTNRQLNQMLQMEGILFSAGTAVVSLLVGCPFGYALFRYAKETHVYGINEYHFPLMEIGVMILAILLLQATLSFLLSRNLQRESLVERISYHI